MCDARILASQSHDREGTRVALRLCDMLALESPRANRPGSTTAARPNRCIRVSRGFLSDGVTLMEFRTRHVETRRALSRSSRRLRQVDDPIHPVPAATLIGPELGQQSRLITVVHHGLAGANVQLAGRPP